MCVREGDGRGEGKGGGRVVVCVFVCRMRVVCVIWNTMCVSRVEMEQRQHEEETRRQRARQSKTTFIFGGLTIREAVFDIEEKEDLSLFKDPEAPEVDEDDEEEKSDQTHGHEKSASVLGSGEHATTAAGVTVNAELFGGDDDGLDDLDDDM